MRNFIGFLALLMACLVMNGCYGKKESTQVDTSVSKKGDWRFFDRPAFLFGTRELQVIGPKDYPFKKVVTPEQIRKPFSDQTTWLERSGYVTASEGVFFLVRNRRVADKAPFAPTGADVWDAETAPFDFSLLKMNKENKVSVVVKKLKFYHASTVVESEGNYKGCKKGNLIVFGIREVRLAKAHFGERKGNFLPGVRQIALSCVDPRAGVEIDLGNLTDDRIDFLLRAVRNPFDGKLYVQYTRTIKDFLDKTRTIAKTEPTGSNRGFGVLEGLAVKPISQNTNIKGEMFFYEKNKFVSASSEMTLLNCNVSSRKCREVKRSPSYVGGIAYDPKSKTVVYGIRSFKDGAVSGPGAVYLTSLKALLNRKDLKSEVGANEAEKVAARFKQSATILANLFSPEAVRIEGKKAYVFDRSFESRKANRIFEVQLPH